MKLLVSVGVGRVFKVDERAVLQRLCQGNCALGHIVTKAIFKCFLPFNLALEQRRAWQHIKECGPANSPADNTAFVSYEFQNSLHHGST